MEQSEVLKKISEEGESAYGLLYDADPRLIQRFNRLDKQLVALLKDVQRHFPDAQYYTASGGFNLLLGSSHSNLGEAQQEMIALVGNAVIGDGDF